MPDPRFKLAFVLQALLIILPSAFGQDSTSNSSNYQNCKGAYCYDPNASVNSTGKIEFRFGTAQDKINQDPFYAAFTFNETRHPSNEFVTYKPEVQDWTSAWLSVRKETRGYACVYLLGGVNASAKTSGSNGCDGVLSSACISALRNVTMSRIDDCDSARFTDETKKLCGGDSVGSALHHTMWTSKSVDLFTDNCTIPAPRHVSIPDGYRSYPVLGYGSMERDVDASSFEWYDIHVQQPVPWIIATHIWPERGNDEIQRDTQVVCVAPNVTVEGSRKPEMQFKPIDESAGAKPSDKPGDKPSNNQATSWHNAGPAAVIVAAMICLVLMV